MQYVTDSL